MNGYCYFVIVKVINGVGVILLFKFDGVMLDDIFLIFGFVVDGLGLDRNYVNGEDDVSVSWFVFMDLEFGIDFYKVVLCYERNLFNCFQFFIFIRKIINVIILGEELVYVCEIFFFFSSEYFYVLIYVFYLLIMNNDGYFFIIVLNI